MKHDLTPDLFDRMTTSPKPARIIWTADAIAAKIGCSADYVREVLAHLDGSPVKKIGGRYVAHEGDLIAFFRA